MTDNLSAPTRLEPDPNCIYYRCVEDSNDAIMITDTVGKMIYVNPAWQALYGYRASEAIGNSARLLHSGRHNADFYKQMWSKITDPTIGSWKGDLFNRAKDGKIINVLLLITPFRSQQSGAIVGYMGIATDISEQKALEEQLRAQESLAAVKHFAERLAHEIGTTLGVIRGRAEMIRTGPINAKKVKSDSSVILNQSDRISRLLTYLLEFCRGADQQEQHPVHLNRLLEGLSDFHRTRIKKNGITFHLPQTPPLTFRSDRKRLRIILNSLVENALDAIERAIQDGRDTEHLISIQTESKGNAIRINIIDTGCGIPEENLHRIFHPFFTTKDVGEGTGIGLTLASRLVKDMGGQINVKSREGEGSHFSIEIPLPLNNEPLTNSA